MVSSIKSTSSDYNINYSDILAANGETKSTVNDDESIFETAYGTNSIDENAESLYAQLESVEDEQGVILNAWNDFKEFTNVGTSAEKCEAAIEQYKNGEITYEEAADVIENFDEKQESSLNLFANIVTGAVALAVTAGTGGLAAVAMGAAAGAVTKAGFKTIDRATNDVEGDALDAKQIAGDAVSGAIIGGSAVLTKGTGESSLKNGVTIGSKTYTGSTACAVSSAKTGIITGGISGGANYVIDCAVDEDKDFDAGEFAVSTIQGSVTGGLTGFLLGGLNGVLRSNNILNVSDSDTTTNIVSNTGYKIVKDKISSAI